MIISIHQPNFFPWFPYFEKIMASDKFVFLLNCQFEKNNYQNRFFMDGKWFTMSVSRHSGLILDKEYLNPEKDWKKIKNALPQYNLSIFDECFYLGTNNLAVINCAIILKIAHLLNIPPGRFSVDWSTDLTGSERLYDICKTYGGDIYLSGESGKKYLDLEKFTDIKVQFHENKRKEPILKCLTELL